MKYLSATKLVFILVAAGIPGCPLISNLAAQRPMPYKAKPIPRAKKRCASKSPKVRLSNCTGITKPSSGGRAPTPAARMSTSAL